MSIHVRTLNKSPFTADWRPATSSIEWARKRGYSPEQIEDGIERCRAHYAETGEAYVVRSAIWRGWMIANVVPSGLVSA